MEHKEIKKWKELSREKVFEAYERSVWKVNFEMPNGSKEDYFIRHEEPQGAVVALTKDKKIIIIREFRPGAGEVTYGLPGGFFEKNETPEEGIARELLEETGYKGEVVLVNKYRVDEYADYFKYCFVATECQKVSESTEDINTYLIDIEEFLKYIRSGDFVDVGISYMALDYLKLL